MKGKVKLLLDCTLSTKRHCIMCSLVTCCYSNNRYYDNLYSDNHYSDSFGFCPSSTGLRRLRRVFHVDHQCF